MLASRICIAVTIPHNARSRVLPGVVGFEKCAICRRNCPNPVILIWSRGEWRGFNDDVITLADTNENTSVGVWLDRYKVGFNDSKIMTVDGENEGCVDRSIDQSQQIAHALMQIG